MNQHAPITKPISLRYGWRDWIVLAACAVMVAVAVVVLVAQIGVRNAQDTILGTQERNYQAGLVNRKIACEVFVAVSVDPVPPECVELLKKQ